MASWFKKPDPKEMMRENERNLRKTNRELDADRRQLERKEKELELEIKKLAKAGQRDACATLAKQLVQLRKQKTKSMGMGAKITAVGVQNRHMYSVGKMADAVASSTETMKAMQKQMPVDKLAKQMREFQVAQEKMGITDEMVSDTLDAMLDESGDEEEQDAVVNQVLDEIGIDLNTQLARVPKASSSTIGESSAAKTSDADLERMLANLRG
uniref:Charged multivesicular body protein 2b n=1 Tax=Steinernema glaseri TaxID=37863 RepID=A0A1I7Z9V1_9BILA